MRFDLNAIQFHVVECITNGHSVSDTKTYSELEGDSAVTLVGVVVVSDAGIGPNTGLSRNHDMCTLILGHLMATLSP